MSKFWNDTPKLVPHAWSKQQINTKLTWSVANFILAALYLLLERLFLMHIFANRTKNLAKILGVLIEVLSAFAEIDLEAEDCVYDWINLGINELASIPIQEWAAIKPAKGHYDEMYITLIIFGYFLAKSEK